MQSSATLAAFRHRLWLLAGLPVAAPLAACAEGPGTSSGTPPAVAIATVTPAPVSTATPEPIETPPKRYRATAGCAKDEHRQWTCGVPRPGQHASAPAPFDDCPADSVPTNQAWRLLDVRGGPPAMPFDGEMTGVFRTTDDPQGDAARRSEACCYSRCVAASVREEGDLRPPGTATYPVCIAGMTKTSRPAAERSDCPAAIEVDGPGGKMFAAPFSATATEHTGPHKRAAAGFDDAPLCCYDAVRAAQIIRGRPLVVDQRPRVAPERASDRGWLDASPGWPVDHLPADDRERIAAAWRRDAALEHASVAAFARLALQLMGLGAPAELVADAHRAAIDETEHASRCYAVARHYDGRALGPGALRLDDVTVVASPVALLVETFRDGCVGETVAAWAAWSAAARAASPELRRWLESIAEDEERHAALAWRIVGWLLATSPDLCACLADELARLSDSVPAPAAPTDDLCACHGVLGPASERRIHAEATAAVVVPIARVLLGA